VYVDPGPEEGRAPGVVHGIVQPLNTEVHGRRRGGDR
jgi:hypothetical protein